MKRIIFYVACLITAVLIPVHSSDVGKLQPIESVLLCQTDGIVELRTDTEDVGFGKTVYEALQNLKDTTPSLAYLDTARFLIVHENAIRHADNMRDILKRNVKICMTNSSIDPKKAAEFLRVHDEIPKLKTWETGQELPMLTIENDRFILLPNQETSA